MWILLAILALGLIIIVHEGGHYFVAKWCKMKVDRFSLGFGPALLTWRRDETEFTLAPIPFGGFVAIRGMNIADEIDASDPNIYPNRPLWQRMAAIFAGPAANYLFAVSLAFVYFLAFGIHTGTSWHKVAGVGENGASTGVLQPGDVITAVNDRPIYRSYEDEVGQSLRAVVQEQMEQNGAPLALTVLRAGKQLTVEITPQLKVPEGEKEATYLIGILVDGEAERADVGVFSAGRAALVYPVVMTANMVTGLYRWARGQVDAELRGPPGIVEDIAKSFSLGWDRALEYLMMFNVWLGLLNLLPLPALDGGRLVFLGYEMATRRRPNPKVEATVHMVGIMFFLLLILVVSVKDIFG